MVRAALLKSAGQKWLGSSNLLSGAASLESLYVAKLFLLISKIQIEWHNVTAP